MTSTTCFRYRDTSDKEDIELLVTTWKTVDGGFSEGEPVSIKVIADGS